MFVPHLATLFIRQKAEPPTCGAHCPHSCAQVRRLPKGLWRTGAQTLEGLCGSCPWVGEASPSSAQEHTEARVRAEAVGIRSEWSRKVLEVGCDSGAEVAKVSAAEGSEAFRHLIPCL